MPSPAGAASSPAAAVVASSAAGAAASSPAAAAVLMAAAISAATMVTSSTTTSRFPISTPISNHDNHCDRGRRQAAPVFLNLLPRPLPFVFAAFSQPALLHGTGQEMGDFLMRIRFVLALIVAPLLASAAPAQGLGGPARLLWIDGVQKDLKL